MHSVDRPDYNFVKRFMLYRVNCFHLIFVAFFLVYLFVGLHVYSDYGVSIDEYSQIDLGRVNYERIVSGSPEIQTHYDRYYGPAFEAPLYVLSTVLNSRFGMDYMSARHLGIFLFFACSLIFFYRLLFAVNGNPAYGLLGVVLLVVSPRFFAESFYNTKDMAFMAATVMVLWALHHASRKKLASIILLAVATGFSIALRAQGLLLFLVVTGVLLFTGNENKHNRIQTICWYAALTLVAAYAMFPVFWNDPIKNIIGFWRSAANPIGVPAYYFGVSYVSPVIPWHYHFVWVGITSLVSVLFTSIIGAVWFVRRVITTGNKEAGRVYVAMLFTIIGSLLTSVFFHPRSYDGWRHMYYIYPCMVGFSVYLVRQSMKFRWFAVAVILMIAIDSLFALRFIIRNHPNQYVYFNRLAGGFPHAKANFDFDYWGISYKQILIYLLSMPVPRPTAVYFQQAFPYTERDMATKLKEKGMTVTPSVDEADVYVTIDRDLKEPPPPSFRKIYAVTVEGADLSAIYLRDRRDQ